MPFKSGALWAIDAGLSAGAAVQGRPALEAAHKTAEQAFIGKLRTNQQQFTPIQDDGRRRKFRVPRFVADNQAASKLGCQILAT